MVLLLNLITWSKLVSGFTHASVEVLATRRSDCFEFITLPSRLLVYQNGIESIARCGHLLSAAIQQPQQPVDGDEMRSQVSTYAADRRRLTGGTLDGMACCRSQTAR